MSMIKMRAVDAHKGAKALLKAAEGSDSAGKALPRNFKQEHRLTKLVAMSDIAGAYGLLSENSLIGAVIWIDEDDAKALELIQ